MANATYGDEDAVGCGGPALPPRDTMGAGPPPMTMHACWLLPGLGLTTVICVPDGSEQSAPDTIDEAEPVAV